MGRKSKAIDADERKGTPARGGRAVDEEEQDPLIGTRMRVWWAPTTNKAKTGFAGAYWPVNILSKRPNGKYEVEYDNGESEDVLTENLAPDDPPVGFGEEDIPLQPGEFCEVSNGSDTDPCAWVGMVSKAYSDGQYLVRYPFHDSDDEKISPELIRRVRVLDMEGWCLLKPNQRWVDGDVLSPHELETIKEELLGQFVDLTRRPTDTPNKSGKGKDATHNGNSNSKEEGGNKTAGRKRAAPSDGKESTTRASQRVKVA